jgi:hypothetical protein
MVWRPGPQTWVRVEVHRILFLPLDWFHCNHCLCEEDLAFLINNSHYRLILKLGRLRNVVKCGKFFSQILYTFE